MLGTAEEVCELVAADDRLLPCIDFGHLNCRTGGRMNTREEVKALFDLMENTIGHERTAKLHAHFSHIEYNDKGEVRHLTFADTVYGRISRRSRRKPPRAATHRRLSANPPERRRRTHSP